MIHSSHLTRGFSMDGVGIVKQGGLEEASYINDGPGQHNQGKEEMVAG
jgi:hypothetical protein